MTTYVYQSKDTQLDFATAVEVLEQRLNRKVKINWPPITMSKSENTAILQTLATLGVSVQTIKISKTDYEQYVAAAGYRTKYPHYYSFNFPEKTLEHFVATRLLNLQTGENFIDIAAESSPHSEIFRRLFGCNAFAQDIMYPVGLHQSKIGSDATQVPMPDQFFQAALVACSLEHFESDADMRFINEVARLLDSGGRLVVVPLYLHHFPFTATDPKYSANVSVSFDSDSEVHCVENWGNRHARYYSPQTLCDRLIRPLQGQMKFEVYFVENFNTLHAGNYCRFALLGTKL